MFTWIKKHQLPDDGEAALLRPERSDGVFDEDQEVTMSVCQQAKHIAPDVSFDAITDCALRGLNTVIKSFHENHASRLTAT